MPRKPTHPGINRVRNTPKAFRSHGGLNRLICAKPDTIIREGLAIIRSKKWQEQKAQRDRIQNAWREMDAEIEKKNKAAEQAKRRIVVPTDIYPPTDATPDTASQE